MTEWFPWGAVLWGDCLEVLASMPDASVDAVVTDPPYALGFMGRGWDKVLPPVEVWQHVLRVCKPGAHLAAFGGSRTFHRLFCNIEDAGWELRDTLSWLYGQGFPKSLDLGEGRGTALKPGYEPIALARKPIVGTNLKNVARFGTGGLNIDACRVYTDESTARKCNAAGYGLMHGENPRGTEGATHGGHDGGRWPANVVLDEDAAALLDEQTGILKSGSVSKTYDRVEQYSVALGRKRCSLDPSKVIADKGGASRFFYVAKASTSEREEGLEHLPARMIDPKRAAEAAGRNSPRAGAGRRSERRNHHPTVKPIALMNWVGRLVVPPGGLVLDPFFGSGSTGCGLVGYAMILGIEREKEYVEIAQARVSAWHRRLTDG